MEHPEESGSGYPEEQPAEVVDQPTGTPQRKGGESDGAAPGTENEDEGTATGNPKNAGAEE
jgi:hypothetical protein